MTTKNSSMGVEFARTFSAGQKLLNRYKLDRVLGQGGMGIVWLARDEELERDVAIKFLPAIVINDRASLNDLKRETKRSLELTHPNIVRTYDFVQDNAIAGISMEYVDSDTLRSRRVDRPSGIFEPAELGEWTRQLCDALDYAHHHAEIVHRDLKPANLMVNGRNHLKVADFGISRSLVESVTQISGAHGINGTLVYMSPQQLAGEPARPLDDVYAVGATLFDLCTTRPPFYSGDISGQIYGKAAPSMTERRTALGITGAAIPENWEATIAACLAKEPARRPQSAGEIAARLGLRPAATVATVSSPPSVPAAVAQEPIRALQAPFLNAVSIPPAPIPPVLLPPPVPSVPSVPPRGERKNLVILGGGALVAVVLIAFAAWQLFGHSTTSKQKGNPARSNTEPSGSTPEGPSSEINQKLSQSGVETARSSAQLHGSVIVKSEPSAAKIVLDGVAKETTPASLENLTEGQHEVVVTLDGYEDFRTTINVRDNSPIKLDKIALERSTGSLEIVTNDPTSSISLKAPDNSVRNFLGSMKSEKLPTGDYNVSVTRNGWKPIARSVKIAKGNPQTVKFDLSGGTLTLSANTLVAKVMRDGAEVGITPLIIPNMEPGDFRYTLQLAGYSDDTVEGRIASGQELKLDRKMTKLAAVKAPTSPSRTASRQTRSRRRGDDDSDNRNSDGAAGRWFERAAPYFFRR